MASYNYTFASGDTVTPTKLNNARTVSDIVNADVSATAAIAGTKVAPDFGGQNVVTGGTVAGSLVQAAGNGFIGLRQRCHANAGTGAPEFISSRSRGDASSPTIVGNDDALLIIAAQGYDGSDYRNACFISCDVDGTPGSSDMPGRIVFSTSADGSATPTERMRIAANGNIGIGTNSPSYPLDLVGTCRVGASASANFRIDLGRTGVGGFRSAYIDGDGTDLIIINQQSGALRLGTNNAERMRIDASGNVGVGTSSPNAAAVLDVASTTKGFLPPRMTTAQRDAISTPPAGLVIYNTSTNVLNFYNGSVWGAV
jgi:hypothetical protein